MEDKEKIVFRIPNKDTYTGPYTMVPKEIIQKAYIDKIGSEIKYGSTKMKVTNVTVTEEEIIVELE